MLLSESQLGILLPLIRKNLLSVQAQKLSDRQKVVDLYQTLSGVTLSASNAYAAVRPLAIETRDEIGAKGWRELTDEAKLQAVVSHYGSGSVPPPPMEQEDDEEEMTGVDGETVSAVTPRRYLLLATCYLLLGAFQRSTWR